MKAKVTKKELVTAFRTREILDAARHLMESRGTEAVTMDEIAAGAGVAKGTIYLYFASKEDLVYTLMSEVGENILKDLTSVLETPDPPVQKLTRILALFLDYVERERFLFPIYARELPAKGQRGAGSRVRELEEQILGRVTHLFTQGAAQGHFIAADPRLLTFLIRGLVLGVGHYQMAAGRPAREALPALSALVFSGLINRSEALREVAKV